MLAGQHRGHWHIFQVQGLLNLWMLRGNLEEFFGVCAESNATIKIPLKRCHLNPLVFGSIRDVFSFKLSDLKPKTILKLLLITFIVIKFFLLVCNQKGGHELVKINPCVGKHTELVFSLWVETN